MSNAKYFALSGMGKPTHGNSGAQKSSVWLDGDVIPGCIFAEAHWITDDMSDPGFVKHDSDEMLIFVGSDPDVPESLNAELELWLENDKLTLTDTCVVFVPAGAAHGRLIAKNVKKPIICLTVHTKADHYLSEPAQATKPAGTYSGNYAERYEPPSGEIPDAPPGFITFLLWLDDVRMKGAPYLETVWFHTTNDSGPPTHCHDDLDELIGFLGSDPENPSELGAEVSFLIGDEYISTTKSCIIFIPRGLKHSPILVPQLERPIIHFSTTNGGEYNKDTI